MHAFIICIYHLISPDCFTLKEIHPSPRFHPKESIGLLVHLQLICQIGMSGPFLALVTPGPVPLHLVAPRVPAGISCACCTPLCTFSVLTYALTGKKKKITRLNSLHPSLEVCKTKKTKKKTNPMSQALWPSRFSLFFCFCFFCFFFVFFLFFWFC